jgi:N-acetylneuraminic acid mutarotase
MEVYNPQTDSWTSAAPMITGRSSLAAVVVNGKIYAVGGRDPQKVGAAQYLGALEVYDPSATKWTALANLPTPRQGPTVGAVAGLLYVAGGVDNAGSVTSLVEVYDPSTDHWSTMAPLLTARASPAAAVIGQKLYVIGGYISNAEVTANEVATLPAVPPCDGGI